MVDDLDRYAARRVVIVTEEPLLDGSCAWKLWVDCDESISPNMAKGLLYGGIDFIDEMSRTAQEGQEEGQGE